MQAWAFQERDARSGTPADGVLRARGLIIEDEAGRERILIGAPVPEAANRVRTDEARVQEVWASRYPDADGYMGYYQGYSHETNGLLILSEDGFDRLVLGDPVPDPNIGRRSAPAGHEWTGLAEAFQGLLVRRDGEIVHQVNAARHR